MPEELKRPRGRPRKEPVIVISDSVADDIWLNKKSLKIHIYPDFPEGETGGIPRVVEGQKKHLPTFGIEVVETAEEADLICCHVTVPTSYAKRFPNKPLVVINHGLYWDEYEWNGEWHKKVNGDAIEAIRISDSVATCSEWVANSLRRHTSRTVTVIPHGIDMEDWDSTLEKKEYVLWNKTRPDPVCNPEPMNEVAALLPNVKFVSTFGKEARNVVLTDKMPFADAKKLIMQAGVYLCTARETFGIGTLEALACGVPVVGFDFGGQSEFITHMYDGYLVQPGDITGLAEGIRWALEEGKRVDLSARCIEKANKFKWEYAVEKYADLFRKTYEQKTSRGPRTSIIVTNYNLHEYLPACLESIRNQTDQDWECIIVDDASPDKTGWEYALGASEADPRFRTHRNDKNVYLAEARNIGIRLAKGKYILPLDADDRLAPDTVKLLADDLDSDRFIHIAYGGVLFTEEDGETLTDYSGWYNGKNPYGLGHSSWPLEFTFEQQITKMNLLPYSSMFRKEVWEQTGGYRRRCRTAEDADFWTRVSSYGFRPKMVTKHDTLIYRNRQESMSRKQGDTDWIRWFSWAKLPTITPAGAVTATQLPVGSLDPIIISVIIPVGEGHEKLLSDAVDSVDTQSFRNWECIVINDTGKPLETELPTWVRLLETGGKTGPAKARNIGIKASKGRLFLPLDADDYLQPDCLQEMFNAYLQTRDVIYSDFWQTDQSGRDITVHHCDDYDPKLLTGGKRVNNGVTVTGMIHSVTALTPKSVWEKVGGYDEQLPGWEDWDFQLAIADIGQCSRRIAAPLFVYRKHTGMRREANHEAFEQSKEGILRKWGRLWNGGKELMACGSCGRRQTVPSGSGVWAATSSRRIESEEAVLIEYTGNKAGAMPFRGPSKTMYWFAAGDKRYVLKEDIAFFLKYSEFREAIVTVPPEELVAPVLVADGSPNIN